MTIFITINMGDITHTLFTYGDISYNGISYENTYNT
jgi:hypothetical protein